MTTYVAFLRAINVGGHVVKMTTLKRLFETLGLSRVETFIASGNVVFESPARDPKSLEGRIEKHLLQKLGYPVATFIRTLPELSAIAACNPFPALDLTAGGGLYIAFLPDRPEPSAAQRLMSAATKVDTFQVHGREVYWLIRAKFSESEFSGARLEKVLGMPATIRNATTVRRMAGKYA